MSTVSKNGKEHWDRCGELIGNPCDCAVGGGLGSQTGFTDPEVGTLARLERGITCPQKGCGISAPHNHAPTGTFKALRDATMPEGSAARKAVPLASGVLDYFPAALAAVAELSKAGNDKHNPGEELHWARGKSTDQADCIMRHLVDRGKIDPEDGILHDVKVAWRALAMLQEELEKRGAPLSRGSRVEPPGHTDCTDGLFDRFYPCPDPDCRKCHRPVV